MFTSNQRRTLSSLEREPAGSSDVRVYSATGERIATITVDTRERKAVRRRKGEPRERLAPMPASSGPLEEPTEYLDPALRDTQQAVAPIVDAVVDQALEVMGLGAPAAAPAPKKAPGGFRRTRAEREALLEEIEGLQLLDRVKKAVHDLDPLVETDSDLYRAAVVLAMSFAVGQSANTLARMTGYDEGWTAEVRGRWVRAGLWNGGRGNPNNRKRMAVASVQEALETDDEGERAAACAGRSTITFWLVAMVGINEIDYHAETDTWGLAEWRKQQP